MAIEFTAFRTRQGEEDWEIIPAPVQREWMERTEMKAALRCLPLSIANQAGWWITSPASLTARWNGRPEPAGLEIRFESSEEGRYRHAIRSNFGSGIVTFILPWLFRTADGYALQVRGPTNYPRPDVVPLDGIVETDWSPYSFTMNWKITRPGVDVLFRRGEPICQIIPFPIGVLEEVKPRMRPIETERDLYDNFIRVVERRNQPAIEGERWDGRFELNYTRGYRPDGVKAPAHRSTLKLQSFVEFRY